MSLKVNNLVGFDRRSGGGGSILTYLDFAKKEANHTSNSYTGFSFGPAAADRHIIVAVMPAYQTTAGNISSLTIGGIAATELYKIAPGSWRGFYLGMAAVPTGTSGTIFFNANQTLFNSSIAAWSITGLVNPLALEDMDVDTGSTPGVSMSLGSPCAVIALSHAYRTAGAVATTWANPSLTENFDENLEAGWPYMTRSAASGSGLSGVVSAAPTFSSSLTSGNTQIFAFR